MKTDMKLNGLIREMVKLRIYDDDMSIIVRLQMIAELNMQIKNILLLRHTEKIGSD